MDDLYTQEIIELYKNPPHKKELKKYNKQGKDENISCGDKLRIQLLIKNKKIINAGYLGNGCAISQASANILLDAIIGKDLKQIMNLSEKKFLNSLNIPISLERMKCATLSFKILKKIL